MESQAKNRRRKTPYEPSAWLSGHSEVAGWEEHWTLLGDCITSLGSCPHHPSQTVAVSGREDRVCVALPVAGLSVRSSFYPKDEFGNN